MPLLFRDNEGVGGTVAADVSRRESLSDDVSFSNFATTPRLINTTTRNN